jgi:hypothetical protein
VQSRHHKRAKDSGQASGSPDRKPARADSKPPRVLTEDEADILYGEKHKQEPGIPLRKALKELGIDESEVGL